MWFPFRVDNPMTFIKFVADAARWFFSDMETKKKSMIVCRYTVYERSAGTADKNQWINFCFYEKS